MPLIMSLRHSSLRFFIGVLIEKPYLSHIADICQNISEFLYLPNAVIPPSFIDSDSLGISLLRSIMFTYPSPLHFGQAPSGELNEKLCGAGSL